LIDMVNFVVAALCAFVLGLCSHSILLHEMERHGWKFPWDRSIPIPVPVWRCEWCGSEDGEWISIYDWRCHVCGKVTID